MFSVLVLFDEGLPRQKQKRFNVNNNTLRTVPTN